MIVGQVLFLLAVTFVCYCNGDQESCLRFGGGACCPQVHPTDRTLQQVRCSLGRISRLQHRVCYILNKKKELRNKRQVISRSIICP